MFRVEIEMQSFLILNPELYFAIFYHIFGLASETYLDGWLLFKEQ
jgi:hypothetical protein